jgi:hypothetical protein
MVAICCCMGGIAGCDACGEAPDCACAPKPDDASSPASASPNPSKVIRFMAGSSLDPA